MKNVLNDDIWFFDMFISRISYHSQKIEGAMREKIVSSKALLSKAEEIANKICEEKDVEQIDIKSTLEGMKELKSWIAENKITDNHSQKVIIESVDSIIASLED